MDAEEYIEKTLRDNWHKKKARDAWFEMREELNNAYGYRPEPDYIKELEAEKKRIDETERIDAVAKMVGRNLIKKDCQSEFLVGCFGQVQQKYN